MKLHTQNLTCNCRCNNPHATLEWFLFLFSILLHHRHDINFPTATLFLPSSCAAIWTLDLNEIVKASWEKAKLAGIGPSLANRTRAVHADLHKWDRKILKGLKRRINKLKKELEILRRGPMNTESHCLQKEIIVVIENLLDQEEIFWL